MKAYAAYKDSEVPWAGAIPSHWTTSRGKWLFRRMSRPVRPEDEVVTAFRDGTVTLRKNRREDGFTNSLLEIGYQGIRKGDLVIHAMDAFAGAIGVSDSDGKSTPVYAACVPVNGANPSYFCRLLRHMSRAGYIEALARGIRERSSEFRFEQFANLVYPVPPRPEQDAIVAFLEAKEAEIQKFIANQRRQIELIRELKKSFIENTVLRGTRKLGGFKDSGIPWRGVIPGSYGVLRLKFAIGPIEQGWSPQCDAQPAVSNSWGVLKVGCVNDDHFNEKENKALPQQLLPIPSLEIRNGDILVSRANSRELVGSAAIVENCRPKLMLCDKLFRFRARKAVALSNFLVLALRTEAIRRQLEAEATGASSSMLNIGQETLKNVLIPLPPIEEQLRIVELVEEVRAETAQATAHIQNEIARMTEYRTALIAAAVTGGIDVRNM